MSKISKFIVEPSSSFAVWKTSKILNSPSYIKFLGRNSTAYHLDEEDAFKKRGTAFESEYIRKVTAEQIKELKKKINQERQHLIKRALEKEKQLLEETLEKLDKSDKKQ
ncbi:hypothetical protein D910_05932 [Dendroctonus ponderosae]